MKKFSALLAVMVLLTSSLTVDAQEVPTMSVNVIVAGDNLIHSMIIKSGLQEDGSYNYDYMYDHVRDYISAADIAVINQETPLVNDPSLYSGYPTFGSPVEIGDAVINAGFDVVGMANNHVCDKGATGMHTSMNYFTDRDIPVVGLYERNGHNIQVVEKNGIKIAFLGYTYGTNGIPIPKDSPYTVGDLNDETQIASDLAYANRVSDIQIVLAHWGTEYQDTFNQSQFDKAQFLADAGADVIVGSHPHIVQPLDFVMSNKGQAVPVYYSLGNFISNQDQVSRMLGALAEFTIVRDDTGVHVAPGYHVSTTVTHIGTWSEKFEVYLRKDYTEELCNQHRLHRIYGNKMSLDALERISGDAFIVQESWYRLLDKKE